MGNFAKLEIDGRIATVTLSRPETRNAIATHQDCDDLVTAIELAAHNAEVSVLILTGAGSAFCAGGDLKAMKERYGIGPLDSSAATRGNYKRGVQRIPLALMDAELITIAAVNGPAIGLGCGIAAYCDMRIGAVSARFASSFVKLGLIPGDGGTWILPRVVDYAHAVEMIATGEAITADKAAAIGLISQVVPDGDLMAEARLLAERVAANPPQAVRFAKRLLKESRMAELPTILELAAAFQAMSHESSEYHAAVEAFAARS
nr:enoyl-CoA hydratase-related protein [Sphingobium sp. TKS]